VRVEELFGHNPLDMGQPSSSKKGGHQQATGITKSTFFSCTRDTPITHTGIMTDSEAIVEMIEAVVVFIQDLNNLHPP
jgi:hypothetical protein